VAGFPAFKVRPVGKSLPLKSPSLRSPHDLILHKLSVRNLKSFRLVHNPKMPFAATMTNNLTIDSMSVTRLIVAFTQFAG
jgi:hypothetical protein